MLNKKELRALANGLRAIYSASYVAEAVNEAHRLSKNGRLKTAAIWDQIVREMEQSERYPHRGG